MVDIREPSRALHREQGNHLTAWPELPTDVRVMEDDDLPWLIDICKRRYVLKDGDPEAAALWFKNFVTKNPLLFYPIRTENAFLIAQLNVAPWQPSECECNILQSCAEEGAMFELLKLFRASINWGIRHRATLWRVTSDTWADLGPLAKRVGCNQQTPRYWMRIGV